MLHIYPFCFFLSILIGYSPQFFLIRGLFKQNESSPTFAPPFALSGLYSLLTRCSLELPPK